MAKLKAAGYLRVSSAMQAVDGLSLDDQGRRIRARAEAEGWELGELFEDAGVSGRKASRPALDAMLGRLGDFDRIIVAKLDRLGRRAAGMLDLFERLDAAGVELVSLGDDLPTGGKSGRLMRTILAALAEWEAETIGERTASTARERAAQGRPHGPAPYGFKSEGGRLVPVEAEAAVVERIFAEAVAGVSQVQIARRLNAEKVKPRTAKEWTQTQISKILHNPTYAGRIPFNGEVFEGLHNPIVEPEVWERAKVERERANRQHPGRPPGPNRNPAGPHLFTNGLLRCGHCGEAMSPVSYRREGRYEYRCSGRKKNGLDSCPQTPISRPPLDRAAFDYFRAAGLDLEGMRDRLGEAVERRRVEVAAQLAEAEAEARRTADAVARVRADYMAGEISAADWRDLKPDLEAAAEAACERLAELSASESAILEAAGPESEAAAVERLAEIQAAVAGELAENRDLDAVRAALARMFDGFVVYRASRPPRGVPVWARELGEYSPAELAELFRSEGSEPIPAADWIILPIPAAEVFEGLDENLRPILRREALDLPNNQPADNLTG